MGRRSNLTVLKVPNKSSKSQTSPEGWNLCPRLCQQFSWSNNVPASVISGSLNHQGTKDRITTQFCNRVNTEYKFLCTDFLAKRKPLRGNGFYTTGWRAEMKQYIFSNPIFLLLFFCCWRHCKDLKGFLMRRWKWDTVSLQFSFEVFR